ncbi:MAG: respiratory nitrate reductase subunit gamma [Anaerolineae bacterium]|jgi:nitrate reductase gamma subunit
MTVGTAETIFWIVHLPLMVLFIAGMGIVLATWMRAGAQRRSVGDLTRDVFRTVFSPRLGFVVRVFITEAWFNRRLWRTSLWRWLNHFLLLTGFILLMTLSGISALSDKVLIHFLHLEHVPVISMWVTPDHPVTGLLNEIGGVMMTIGFLFFVIRRYARPPSQLRTGPMDTWMVVGLGTILLSGWVAEVVRLNSSHVGPTAYVAFLGYPLALLSRGLPLPWDELHAWMYVIHGLFTSVVIATIPFSKFMHVIAGALVTMVRQMEAARGGHAGLEKGGARVPA